MKRALEGEAENKNAHAHAWRVFDRYWHSDFSVRSKLSASNFRFASGGVNKNPNKNKTL
jgi:hypothetical protein